MHPATKPLVFLLCLWPFAWLLYGAFTDALGANPAETLVRSTGDWTLRFICIVLAVTPLRVISGWNALALYRRAGFAPCAAFADYQPSPHNQFLALAL